jgi:hypothetical protein
MVQSNNEGIDGVYILILLYVAGWGYRTGPWLYARLPLWFAYLRGISEWRSR